MSKNKELFKQAIADAKQIRETALANAKAALEESLSPTIQNMLKTKLQEMESDDLDENQENELDESEKQEVDESVVEENDDLELSELLAELDDEESVNEAEDNDESSSEDDSEESEEPAEDESEESEEVSDDDKISSLTVADFKNIIRDIVSTEEGMEDSTPMDDMEPPADDNMGGMPGEGDDVPMDEEFNLDELLAELDALDEAKAKKNKAKEKMVNESQNKKELNQAILVIENLRKELKEVNLLNSKLLYVNKIFKAQNLNESQKMKVLEAFDKATTTKEAKLVYESLSKTIVNKSVKKQNIKESLGFASKAAGVGTGKKQIVEVNDAISRMQILAGIKKK